MFGNQKSGTKEFESSVKRRYGIVSISVGRTNSIWYKSKENVYSGCGIWNRLSKIFEDGEKTKQQEEVESIARKIYYDYQVNGFFFNKNIFD